MINQLDKLNNYSGPSMNPTLKGGDGLIVLPYNNEKIRCGDVITFKLQDRDHNIVHRVVKVDNQGIYTKGDNNNKVDKWIITPDDLIGRVVSIKRENRELPISGGLRGRVYGFFITLYNIFRKKIPTILHPIYHAMADTGIFRKLLPLSNTRLLSIKRPDGIELQLVKGRKIIARRLPKTDQWQIKKPYRLFMDAKQLP